MRRAFIVATCVIMFASTARAEIAGRANVIDGDTIEIAGQRIRLYGIDAPEAGQTCVAETHWRCGQQAAFALSTIIGGHWVHCAERDRDQYGRIVAVCRLSGPSGPDVNAQMVRQGWALAYRQFSTDYVAEEQAANKDRVGVWRGTFQAPWDYRIAQQAKEPRPTPPRAAPAPCNIKGNISAKGERIYHVPGGAFYADTQINPSNGERWFCSEVEAQAAGWRRSAR